MTASLLRPEDDLEEALQAKFRRIKIALFGLTACSHMLRA